MQNGEKKRYEWRYNIGVVGTAVYLHRDQRHREAEWSDYSITTSPVRSPRRAVAAAHPTHAPNPASGAAPIAHTINTVGSVNIIVSERGPASLSASIARTPVNTSAGRRLFGLRRRRCRRGTGRRAVYTHKRFVRASGAGTRCVCPPVVAGRSCRRQDSLDCRPTLAWCVVQCIAATTCSPAVNAQVLAPVRGVSRLSSQGAHTSEPAKRLGRCVGDALPGLPVPSPGIRAQSAQSLSHRSLMTANRKLLPTYRSP